MNAAKKTLARTKKFVVNHKTSIAAVTASAATAAVMLKTQAKVLTQYHDFLKEKGLYEEFFKNDAL